jgi:hypothetical protein
MVLERKLILRAITFRGDEWTKVEETDDGGNVALKIC